MCIRDRLNTVSLLDADVALDPLVAVDGAIGVRSVEVRDVAAWDAGPLAADEWRRRWLTMEDRPW